MSYFSSQKTSIHGGSAHVSTSEMEINERPFYFKMGEKTYLGPGEMIEVVLYNLEKNF